MISRKSFLPLIWPAVFYTAAFILPVLSILKYAGFSGIKLKELLFSGYYAKVYLFTVKQAFWSTVLSVAAGLPGAWILGRFMFPGRRLLKSISAVPFVMPPIIVVLGFILVFGNSGIINKFIQLIFPHSKPFRILYSFRGIILAHVFYNFPLTIRIVSDSLSRIPMDTFKAAKSLGAGRIRIFFNVTLPIILPSILTAAAITFLYCFMSFAIILVLGGSPDFSTLEVEIYRLAKYQFDFSKASILAVIETFTALLLLAAYLYGISRLKFSSEESSENTEVKPPVQPGITGKILSLLYSVPVFILIFLPLFMIIMYSFLYRPTRGSQQIFTLMHWIDFFKGAGSSGRTALKALSWTLFIGLFTALNTVITASLAAWRTNKTAGILSMLPLGISPVMLGLGFLIISSRLNISMNLRVVYIIAAHTVISLPFSYAVISERLKRIPDRIINAAAVSGASPFRILTTVKLPFAGKAVLTSFIFSFAISAGEMNSTIILAGGNITTIPIAIYRMIGAYNIYGASVMASILIIISAAGFAAMELSREENN